MRQSIAGLHTWAGLLTGWLLFAVFLTGTVSYFRDEITRWMQPEIGQLARVPDATAAVSAIERLTAVASDANRWMIDLPTERDPTIRTIIRRAAGHGQPLQRETLDGATGKPIAARQTAGGDFLYYFHFDLYMPWRSGRILVCTAAILMLVAIISGVITHRRIFADFFTFRAGKAQRSWLDAHNAFGVLTLPFLVMITYSGLITLIPLYMPWGIAMAYSGEPQAFAAELFAEASPRRMQHVSAPLAPIEPLLASAALHWDGGSAGRIVIDNPGDRSATVRIVRRDTEAISVAPQSITFDGATGALIAASHAPGPATATRGVLYGLHLARFSGPTLRWLFFGSGAAGTAMIATGLILWVVKRRRKQAEIGATFGHRLVEALNIAAVTGLMIAIGAYFWSNRLLPTDLATRQVWEVCCFFLAWLLAGVHAACRSPHAAWRDQLWIAAMLYAGLPVLNALTTTRSLPSAISGGDWIFAGFDLVTLATGLVLALGGWRFLKPGDRMATTPRPRGEQSSSAIHSEPT
ncbi:PepSY-associated TM helix domain-containing protein [Bradyrhizobium cenepequi]